MVNSRIFTIKPYQWIAKKLKIGVYPFNSCKVYSHTRVEPVFDRFPDLRIEPLALKPLSQSLQVALMFRCDVRRENEIWASYQSGTGPARAAETVEIEKNSVSLDAAKKISAKY